MKKILVVDDEPSLRFSLEHFLKSGGYAVTTASTYEDAVSVLSGEQFDLVVTDLLLGSRSGIDLLAIAKAGNPDCRVVVITGYPHQDSAESARQLGAFDYLPKPVRKDDILRIAARALEPAS